MNHKIKTIGVMGGTSLDGIDFVYTSCKQTRNQIQVDFLDHHEVSFPAKLKKLLTKASTHKNSAEFYSEVNKLYSQFIANNLVALTRKKNWQIDIIGVHGQTIFHRGKKSSWQLFNPSQINAKLNKPVIYDFRSKDIALGGEGAPLAPFFHQTILPKTNKAPTYFLNIGGIANITKINKSKLIAFDTGPGNALIDAWALKVKGVPFDSEGVAASQGVPDAATLKQLLKYSFFKKKPPKSTGKEVFNLGFIQKYGAQSFKKLSYYDQMATLTELTAITIANSISLHKPSRVYVAGGGVLNKHLLFRIKFLLPECEILTSDELGWPIKAIEAGAFAYLAAMRFFRIKINTKPVTGAKSSALLLGNLCE